MTAPGARAEVLSRIRRALGSGPDSGPAMAGREPTRQLPIGYRQRGELDLAERLDLLASRLADYKAVVCRCTPDELPAAIAGLLAERGARRLVVPDALDLELPADIEVVADHRLTPAQLDGCDAVLTRAAVAIAETGTLVLDGSAGQGRRAVTLVPDFHLCVVFADQVVELVPEAIARLAPERPLTFISGPSATSDIELNRVEGVHGPRTLSVIIAAAGGEPVSRVG